MTNHSHSSTNFPTSKIELHQWFNSLLLVVVGFFAVETYRTIQADHEKLANHETRISVLEDKNAMHSQLLAPRPTPATIHPYNNQ